MPRGGRACECVNMFEERPEVTRADQVLSKCGGSRMQAPRPE